MRIGRGRRRNWLGWGMRSRPVRCERLVAAAVVVGSLGLELLLPFMLDESLFSVGFALLCAFIIDTSIFASFEAARSVVFSLNLIIFLVKAHTLW